ncbi:MAG: uracil-DNA glycosylase [Hyphomicrobiaceae bacterium]|nr:uracil-DNA glycosylase [Hyphomicrobiaceae bacterium]
MQDRMPMAALAQVLDWYQAMGVTDLVDEDATDWLAGQNRVPGGTFAKPAGDAAHAPGPARAAPAAPRPAPRIAPRTEPLPAAAPRQFAGTAPDAAVMSARTEALAAASLAELAAILARFDGCSLKATAKNLVFFRGAEKARLMLIGEAPGRDEDQEGRPFVGRAGQLLDKMLAAAGLAETDVHITNIVYWRPPGNRTPTPQEAQVCRPFLERQVELVAPEIIVPLGGAAAKHLLDVADGIMKLRGKLKPVTVGRHAAKAMATLHPAYLLRTPAAKRQAWRDLLAIRALLDGGTQA